MDIYEELVMQYVVGRGPHIFLSPQYSIKEDRGEWSCPDFLVLDFREEIVSVVEVSSGWDVSGLISKIKDREKQWFTRLRDQLTTNSAVDNAWRFRGDAFVRSDVFDRLTTAFGGNDEVRVRRLEDIAFRWKWAGRAAAGAAEEYR